MVFLLVVGLGNLEGEGWGESTFRKAAEDFGKLGTGLGAGQFLGAKTSVDARGEGLR